MARILASRCRLLSEEVSSSGKTLRGSSHCSLGASFAGPSSTSNVTAASTISTSSLSPSPSSSSTSPVWRAASSFSSSSLFSWPPACFPALASPPPPPQQQQQQQQQQRRALSPELLAASQPLLCSGGLPSAASHTSNAAQPSAGSRDSRMRLWSGKPIDILKACARNYRESTKARPYSMGFAVCFLKGVAASLLAQTAIEHKEKVDRSRVWALALFSGLFTGCGYHYIFNIAFVRAFGQMAGLRTLLPRMMADAIVVFPLMYMPTFLLIDEMVRFGSPAGAFPRWENDIQGSMVEYVKVWPLANMLSFTVIPTELRVSFMATVSFAWLVMLSIFSQ